MRKLGVAIAMGAALVACTSFSSSTPDTTAADAGTDGAPPSASPCDQTHTLCADFDDGDLLKAWDNVANDLGGKADIDTSDSRSAPGSARLVVPAGSGQCAYAELNKKFTTPYSHVKLAFDARVGDTATDFDAFNIAYLSLGRCALGLEVGHDVHSVFAETDLSTGNGTDAPTLKGIKEPGRWAHIELELDATAGTFAARIDGETVLADGAWPQGCAVHDTVTVNVGPHCVVTNKARAAVHIDNVVVDAN